ncbi:MAG: hypothetical protein NVS4B2_24000 [Chloroflexota bacterium]
MNSLLTRNCFSFVLVALSLAVVGTTATHAASRSGKPAWRTYHNQAAGYAVSYPASWSIAERSGANGLLTTVFASRRGTRGITVTVRPAGPDGPDISDMQGGHCTAIRANHNLSGLRCFDTLSFNTYIVYFGPAATYTISASHSPGGNVFGHLVKSFRLISH